MEEARRKRAEGISFLLLNVQRGLEKLANHNIPTVDTKLDLAHFKQVKLGEGHVDLRDVFGIACGVRRPFVSLINIR